MVYNTTRATSEWETERCARKTENNVPTTLNSDSSQNNNKPAMPHEPTLKPAGLPKLVASEELYKIKSDVLENNPSVNAKYKEEVKTCAETLKHVGDQLEIDYLRRNIMGLNLEGIGDHPPRTPQTDRPRSARS